MPVLAAVPCQPQLAWRSGIIAASPAMRALLDQIERVAPSSLPVLLMGETGVGKEILAHALHAASGRTGLFVPVNCAALPPPLAETELFGHVRGAFTGADRSRDGLIAQAHGGTLLLDEVGELPPGVQAKLLRVLEDGAVRRVGSNATTQVHVRLVCATHQPLEVMLGSGAFRPDLYHRLAGLTLPVPPLRARPEDIPPLVSKFFAEMAGGRSVVHLGDGTLTWLRQQPWPGNARQLRHAVQRAVLLGDGMLLPADFLTDNGASHSSEPTDLSWLADRRWSDIEREALAWAMQQHGNVRAAALALGLPRSTLADRLRKHGLDPRTPTLLS